MGRDKNIRNKRKHSLFKFLTTIFLFRSLIMKKLIASRTNLMVLFIFAAMLACASAAMAAAPAASGDQVTPSWIEDVSATSGSVDIGSPGGVGIYLDPTAGPWQKNIFGISVSPLPIHEIIAILPAPTGLNGPSWTDWDEQILTPGWSWAAQPTVTLSDDGIVFGTVSTKVNQNDFVVFNFNPAENPGATLTISKALVWNNGVGLPPQNSMVTIIEYPTPEPGTIVLLISGLLALGLGYIRRRK
jgi:hypothetical protein